jgi:ribosome recycling factor
MALDLNSVKERMQKSSQMLQSELNNIRAGRANPNILNKITVDYYGTQTPLNQIASISVVEARVLQISPFDMNILKDIEQAINASDLGLNPNNDGSSIRLAIPMLTEETRKDLVKDVKVLGENAKVAVRNIRRDAMDSAKKDNELSEDSKRKYEDDVQKITDSGIKEVESIVADKEKELLEF